jgi:hypothetical protein
MRGRRVGALILVLLSGLLVTACSGSTSGSAGSTTSTDRSRVIATLTAVAPGASAPELTADAHVVAVRLHAFGVRGTSTAVRGHSIVVTGTTTLPVPDSLLLVPGTFQVRPALCEADVPGAQTSGATLPPLPTACSSERYSLQPPNLIVDTSAGTANIASIAPDPALTPYPSSSAAYDDTHPDNSVLVPLSEGGGSGEPSRYLLGPTVLTGSVVATARASFVDPQWVVNVTLTATGSTAWDDAARTYFHQVLAMDVDGVIVSAPLIQPSSPSFISFVGRLQVSGNFTRKSASQLAAVLSSGPLVTPLQG